MACGGSWAQLGMPGRGFSETLVPLPWWISPASLIFSPPRLSKTLLNAVPFCMAGSRTSLFSGGFAEIKGEASANARVREAVGL